MNRVKLGFRWRILGLAAAVTMLGAPLVAAESASLTDTWLGLPRWLWATVNLVVFWGLLFKYAFPHVRAYFVGRRAQINASLDRAQDQRREAEAMRDALERQVAELRAEVETLVKRAAADGERERERILEQAERERQRLLEQTREEIAQRLVAAHADLVELTARLAAGLAKEQLERTLTAEDARRLFERGLRQLEEKVS